MRNIEFKKGVIFGSSLLALVALFIAAFLQAQVSSHNPDWLSLSSISNFSGAISFLAIVAYTYVSNGLKAVSIWIALGIAFCCGIFFQQSWGERLLHGPEDVRTLYAVRSYLSDFLFASGAVALLVSGVLLLLLLKASRTSENVTIPTNERIH